MSSVNTNTQKPLKIVFCLPGRSFSNNFLKSWSNLMLWCFQNNIHMMLAQEYSSMVHFARALCLGGNVLSGVTQKPFQGGLDYDYIMWIDSDIVFSPKEFEQTLKSPHPVTCGLYRMQNQTQYAVVRNWDLDFYRTHGTFEFLSIKDLKEYKENKQPKYMKVSYSGMGWMLIKKGVIEKISYPWFYLPAYELIGKDGQQICDLMSEDVAFCQKLQTEAKVDIYVDTEVVVGHEKMMVL